MLFIHRYHLFFKLLLLLGLSALGLWFSVSIGAKASASWEVIWNIRFPRSLGAFLIGVNLSLSGLVLQTITRNSLASPSLLGIHQGAALGITLGLLMPEIFILSTQTLAILGAFITGLLTLTFAGGWSGRLSPIKLILAGVAVSAFAISAVRFTFLLEDRLARQVIQWMAGDVSGLRWEDLETIWYWSLGGFFGLFLLSHPLNLLALGEEALKGLGMNYLQIRSMGAGVAAILTGVSVALAGPILFVGLMVPHMARALFGVDHRWLIPGVSLLGGGLLFFADGVSKLVQFPYETPVGVICALIGAPYFIYQTITVKDLG